MAQTRTIRMMACHLKRIEKKVDRFFGVHEPNVKKLALFHCRTMINTEPRWSKRSYLLCAIVYYITLQFLSDIIPSLADYAHVLDIHFTYMKKYQKNLYKSLEFRLYKEFSIVENLWNTINEQKNQQQPCKRERKEK